MLYNDSGILKRKAALSWQRKNKRKKEVTLGLSDHQPDRSDPGDHRMYGQCGIHPVQHRREKDGAGTGAETDRQPHRRQRGSGTDPGERRH